MRFATLALLASALFAVVSSVPTEVGGQTAYARGPKPGDPGVLEYPSSVAPDEATLAAAVRDPSVTTVIFNRGTNPFSAPIYIFRRDGLRLCGRTGNAADVEIATTAGVGIILDECSNVEISGLTIRASAANAECVRLSSAVSTEVEGYARDVAIRDCRLESTIPIRGLVRSRNLTVTNCKIEVTRTNGVGVLWEDGEGLFLTRNRFTTTDGATGIAAVFVRGAQVATAEGQRARTVLLARNRVSGDFATGFDLADVVDVQVQRNVIEFDSATYVGNNGRLGCLVRRAAASALTDRFNIRGNRISGAHTGLWLLNVGTGSVVSNDLRKNGTGTADVRFADRGCALRISLQGPVCNALVDSNDLRALRSPLNDPATIVTPQGTEAICFPATVTNRVERGRPLYLGAPL